MCGVGCVWGVRGWGLGVCERVGVKCVVYGGGGKGVKRM